MKKPIKPRIVIEPTGAPNRPFMFCVLWRGKHWKNSQWFTFEEALVAAGVMGIESLPQFVIYGFAWGGVVPAGQPYYVGE